MEMTGEQLIRAAQSVTWDALNDPEFLKACVPGCETIEKVAENEYKIGMTARVGPVAAKFKATLVLSELDPPHAYSLGFDGQSGAAGFSRGSAKVQLAAQGAATRLTYQVQASVGGKLAQVGSRLVDAAAKKLSEDFFSAFNSRLTSLQAEGQTEPQEHGSEPVADRADKPTVNQAALRWLAAAALTIVLVSLFTFF